MEYHIRWILSTLFIICYSILGNEAAYRSRRRTTSYSMEPWMIAMIVVSCLSIIAVPVVIMICIKCGCCKVQQRAPHTRIIQNGGQQMYPPPPPYGYSNPADNSGNLGNQFNYAGTQGFSQPMQNNYGSPMGTYNTDGKY